MVRFYLSLRHRSAPTNPKLMEGYFHGRATITGCPFETDLIGQEVTMVSYDNLVSVSPYHLYEVYDNCFKNGTEISVSNKAGILKPVGLKPQLNLDDLRYMLTEEHYNPFHGVISNVLSKIPKNFTWDTAHFMQQPFVKFHPSIPRDASDITRLPALYEIYTLFPIMGDEKSAKWQQRVRELKAEQLTDLKEVMQREPWMLCFDSFMTKERFNKIPPLLETSYYESLLPHAAAQPEVHVQAAVAIYFHCLKDRKTNCHTLWNMDDLFRMLPNAPDYESRKRIERQAYAFLVKHQVIGRIDAKLFTIKSDYLDAVAISTALERIQRNSETMPPPLLRGHRVARIYKPLTKDQLRIAYNICTNWITIVEGMPGTGKTSVIEFTFAHYTRVLVCTFIGMMARTLRDRLAYGRAEAAFTIDYLLTVAKKPAGRAWLDQYEVVVFDEFSNESMHLVAKILPLLTNVRKVVFVGDHRQLKPIDPGDPMRDLSDYFGVMELTQNLRVEDHLKSLQEAPALIAQYKPESIHFDRNISIVGRPTDLTHFFKGKTVMEVHVVCLTHKGPNGRHTLNRKCEETWRKLGVLPLAGKGVRIRPGLEIYKGCKICFLKNKNMPYKDYASDEKTILNQSDCVSNGELAIVESIKTLPIYGGWRLVVHSGLQRERKVVWVYKTTDKNVLDKCVDPSQIDLGFATTVYKSQGQQFPYVLVWNEDKPGKQWTRSNMYVAVSRAQKICWIAGTKEDFFTICKRPDPYRRSCLLLFLKDLKIPTHLETDLEALNLPTDLVELSPHEPLGVPSMKQPDRPQTKRSKKSKKNHTP